MLQREGAAFGLQILKEFCEKEVKLQFRHFPQKNTKAISGLFETVYGLDFYLKSTIVQWFFFKKVLVCYLKLPNSLVG